MSRVVHRRRLDIILNPLTPTPLLLYHPQGNLLHRLNRRLHHLLLPLYLLEASSEALARGKCNIYSQCYLLRRRLDIILNPLTHTPLLLYHPQGNLLHRLNRRLHHLLLPLYLLEASSEALARRKCNIYSQCYLLRILNPLTHTPLLLYHPQGNLLHRLNRRLQHLLLPLYLL